MPRPTVVTCCKRIFVGALAILWLASVMQCPLEAAGVLANDYCCGGSSSTPAAKSGCSHDQLSRSLSPRIGDALVPAGAIFNAEFSTSILPVENRGISTGQPGVAVSALAQNWRFGQRTASEPRAPSPLS